MAALTTGRKDISRPDQLTEAVRRGIEQRAAQPSMASRTYQNDQRRLAITEAERLGLQALGKAPEKLALVNQDASQFQREPNRASASYSGEIVAETTSFTIQKTNPLTTVRHLKEHLPKIPKVGERVRISYSADVAAVKSLKMEKKTSRGLHV